ncbi:MAG: TatD family hydrolase [Candidatus Methylomirabilales bacterium]
MPVLYIDAHSHAHGLPWDHWEILGMTGCAAVVLSCSNPHATREIYNTPPGPDEMIRSWEQPLRLARVAEKVHLFKVYTAVAVSSQTRIRDWEQLLEPLRVYLKDPLVVAVGELGLDPVQYFGLAWPIEEQTEALTAQLQIAKETDKPVILHTPTPKEARDFLVDLTTEALPPPGVYKRTYLEADLDLVARVGLDERRLVVDHADASIIEFVLRETEAWIGISIGSSLRPTGPGEAAALVERYGPDRIMLNSDHLAYMSVDPFAIPRAAREMVRRGLGETAIRRVLFENACDFYGLDLTP